MPIRSEQISDFREHGYLIIDKFIDTITVDRLCTHIESLFATHYPIHRHRDQWACRICSGRIAGLHYMVNAWKGDTFIFDFATTSSLAKTIADLCGWPGVRLASDSVWWKSPRAGAVPFHQDDWAIQSFLMPPEFATFWLSLDDCADDVGPLQYADKSNHWPKSCSSTVLDDNPLVDYRCAMQIVAKESGIPSPSITTVLGSRGMASFHYGTTWHGSPPNVSANCNRRAYAVHFIRNDARFVKTPSHPMYHYYKHAEDDVLDSSHFPCLWPIEPPSFGV
jgi:ectoine hydroxylase-related dioxygenase (phytanoyl-CoA dioxygenase family)